MQTPFRLLIILLFCLSSVQSKAQVWQMFDWSLANRCNNLYVDTATNKMYAVGYFNSASGVTANRFAVWDGTSWSTLGPGFNGVAYDVTMYNGEIYVAGQFTSPVSFLAKWDGTSWVSVGGGINNIAVELNVINGELHVGGTFTQAGGNTANRIAKWDGSSWSTYGVGFNQSCQEIVEYNGEIIACGQFGWSGTNQVTGIARWTGTEWLNLGGSTNSNVYAALVDTIANELYIGGDFGMAGSTAATRIAKWNGSSWSALGGGAGGQVNDIIRYGNDIIVGGQFTSIGGMPANRIARWDGTTYHTMGSGFNDFVTVLDTYNGQLVVGGEFLWDGALQNLAYHLVSWNPAAPDAGFTMDEDTICIGSQISFTDTSTSAPDAWQWSFPGASTPSSTAQNPIVQYNTAGTFDVSLIVSNLAGSDTFLFQDAVTVLDVLSTYTVSNDTAFCEGNCVTLQATGGDFYEWSAAGMSTTNASSFTACPSQSTTYYLHLESQAGCADDTVNITVNNNPNVSIVAPDSICEMSAANGLASGADSYLWGNGITTNPLVITPMADTTLMVWGTDLNGCVDSASYFITVNALPALSVAGADTVCTGDASSLTVSGATTYLWGSGITSNPLMVAPIADTTLVVWGTDLNGCVDSASYFITVNSLPSISISGVDTICLGDTTVLTASGADSYLWSTGATSIAIDYAPVTSDFVMLTATETATGCTSTTDRWIEVLPLPAIPLITQNGAVLTSTAAASYQWYDNTTAIPGETSQSFSPSIFGYYAVEVSDANGCSSFSDLYYFQSFSVNELSTAPAIGLAPNPARDMVQVRASGPIKEVWLTDLYGRRVEVRASLLSGNEVRLDVSGLAAGRYLVVVLVGEGRLVGGLVVG